MFPSCVGEAERPKKKAYKKVVLTSLPSVAKLQRKAKSSQSNENQILKILQF